MSLRTLSSGGRHLASSRGLLFLSASRGALISSALPPPSPPAPAAGANLFFPTRRSFFSFPGAGTGTGTTQHLTATRTLPYPSGPLYELIADVDSYDRFVPYCSLSRVTQWSSAPAPDNDGSSSNGNSNGRGRRWPVLADLHVGWGGFNEVFTSRLRCVPGVSVEAVSGDPADASAAAASTVFKSLVTRWSLRQLSSSSSPSTEVHLSIRYQFVNPLYAAVSAAVSDKVAGLMIEAFEKRAHERLASPPHYP
ncbi:Coenzyme Q-binding protein coq10, mitochondrial [Purpureocillium takamizusanense]|uniref:Coenzyme Q-binding protein coq10, mitochondrial n=1 Tax=Purpureocillium takamizusanense TaxID=2060973 RepID=A0A9Q8VBR0_9HYPO|nr:Coenzyme Q-binding protein coq10, mitochondrial [Purpureocillium takamizusanense]UNI19144.1 Coenzyme Q-binding protein coq10, mitochondrial [Purpureocillium takamizusanense]